MTATLIMQLRDAGRLAVDDPLEQHLPGTGLGALTLRQLLSHASGMQREPEGDWWERTAGVDLTTLLAGLTADKIAYPPHHTYHYSNLAYGLLGGMLERLGGKPWTDLLDERILTPLGLGRTTYAATEPYARGYVVHPGTTRCARNPYRHRRDGPGRATLVDHRGPGSLGRLPRRPRPVGAGRRDTDRDVLPVVISDREAWTHGHGLGLELFREGNRVYVGHGGSMPGYGASLAVHRPSRTAVVGLVNAYTLRVCTSAPSDGNCSPWSWTPNPRRSPLAAAAARRPPNWPS
ncbi:serine hydrolase domain-containing protein [Micromonospora sp. M12]